LADLQREPASLEEWIKSTQDEGLADEQGKDEVASMETDSEDDEIDDWPGEGANASNLLSRV
jgi:hypothetical protein